MSSLIDAADALGQGAFNGDGDTQIIHFDATQRRRDKMREKSHQSPASALESKNQPPSLKPEPPRQAPGRKPLGNLEPTTGNGQPPEPARGTLDAYGDAPKTGEAAPNASPALPALSGPELERFLIDFVVEQTGYPPEMVDLEADLEADLGIDSIKKAQLFGELAERFEIDVTAADEQLSLDDFPTLAHVMQFLESHAGTVADVVAAAATPPVSAAVVPPSNNGHAALKISQPSLPTPAPEPARPLPAAETLANGDLESFLVEFVVEQTGYPPEMVELDADLEADLGIDSIKKAQLFGELAEQFAISVDVADESLSLDDFSTLRHVMEFLQSAGSAVPDLGGTGFARADGLKSSPQATGGASATPPRSVEPTALKTASGAVAVLEPVDSASAASAILEREDLEEFLINFVVEQTGYPPEMVELDADLEADLGIDSIKKAQMLAELAEQFAISVDVTDESLSLDDFSTLRHVSDFLAAPPGKVPR